MFFVVDLQYSTPLHPPYTPPPRPPPPLHPPQILCVAMWSLDDYWFYALFTLVMLVLFEAMLCVQRQKNLEMLRSMRREPTVVNVFRAGAWLRVSSEAVTPGEVVSLVARPPTVASAMREAHRRAQQRSMRTGRTAGHQQLGFAMGQRGGGPRGVGMGMDIVSDGVGAWGGLGGDGGGGGGGATGGGGGNEETLAPFDLLLLRGSCVVNEAMLTGESVPQAKSSLAVAARGGGEAWLKVEDGTDSPHRKHVIFSGTKVSGFINNNNEQPTAVNGREVYGRLYEHV